MNNTLQSLQSEPHVVPDPNGLEGPLRTRVTRLPFGRAGTVPPHSPILRTLKQGLEHVKDLLTNEDESSAHAAEPSAHTVRSPMRDTTAFDRAKIVLSPSPNQMKGSATLQAIKQRLRHVKDLLTNHPGHTWRAEPRLQIQSLELQLHANGKGALLPCRHPLGHYGTCLDGVIVPATALGVTILLLFFVTGCCFYLWRGSHTTKDKRASEAERKLAVPTEPNTVIGRGSSDTGTCTCTPAHAYVQKCFFVTNRIFHGSSVHVCVHMCMCAHGGWVVGCMRARVVHAAHMHTHTHTHTRLRQVHQVCVHAHTHAHMCTCTHTRASHARSLPCSHACTHARACAHPTTQPPTQHMQAHIHAHMLTHMCRAAAEDASVHRVI